MTAYLSKPKTIPEKIAWLEERYWKLGHDDEFESDLACLYEVNDDGEPTGEPRRDPLNGETMGLMLLAGSGYGKSAVMKRALRISPYLHDVKETEGGNTLFIEVPPEATLKGLAKHIAECLGYSSFSTRIKTYEAWNVARHKLISSGVKTLIIDECHHLLRKGAGRDVPGAIQALKHMLKSDHAVALIIVGVPELRNVILEEKTAETFRRFDEVFIPKIALKSHSADLFARCLLSCTKTLGIGIDEPEDFAERILFAEHGRPGKAVKLAKRVIEMAILKKADFLSLSDAERIFKKANSECTVTPFQAGKWSVVKKDLEALGWLE